jgi:threonine dehydrogenase-like Zn-dependent dehydrogenase
MPTMPPMPRASVPAGHCHYCGAKPPDCCPEDTKRREAMASYVKAKQMQREGMAADVARAQEQAVKE